MGLPVGHRSRALRLAEDVPPRRRPLPARAARHRRSRTTRATPTSPLAERRGRYLIAYSPAPQALRALQDRPRGAARRARHGPPRRRRHRVPLGAADRARHLPDRQLHLAARRSRHQLAARPDEPARHADLSARPRPSCPTAARRARRRRPGRRPRHRPRRWSTAARRVLDYRRCSPRRARPLDRPGRTAADLFGQLNLGDGTRSIPNTVGARLRRRRRHHLPGHRASSRSPASPRSSTGAVARTDIRAVDAAQRLHPDPAARAGRRSRSSAASCPPSTTPSTPTRFAVGQRSDRQAGHQLRRRRHQRPDPPLRRHLHQRRGGLRRRAVRRRRHAHRPHRAHAQRGLERHAERHRRRQPDRPAPATSTSSTSPTSPSSSPASTATPPSPSSPASSASTLRTRRRRSRSGRSWQCCRDRTHGAKAQRRQGTRAIFESRAGLRVLAPWREILRQIRLI